ncbi:MAG: M3 family metallopeptidase [Proteobacteria bacterium]|nr:M3 family metallopeptidase [Pseudomonadota bacterium]
MKTNQLPQFTTIDPATITAKLQHILEENRQILTDLLSKTKSFTWENCLHPLENLEDRLQHFWSPISHLNSTATRPELRAAYNAGIPLITDYQTEMGQNQALYQAILQISENETFNRYDHAQKMVIKHYLRDFKLSGVALGSEEKQRFAQLSKELSLLYTRFEENVLDATDGWSKHITDPHELSGLPEIAVHAAQDAAAKKQLSGWLFNLEAPSYIAVMQHADSASLRQELYTAYVTRASDQGPKAGQWDNTALINEILKKRLEKAQLLGFNNYAELSLTRKMVTSPQEVLEFLHKLLEAARPKAVLEFAELQEFAGQNGHYNLQPWDVAYYSEKLRQQRYNISQEELRAYFPLDKVLEGLFTIVHRLFGMNCKQIEGVDVWHPDVRCYAMFDSENELRSYFYTDLFARANKRGGAWMDEYSGRRRLSDGSLQIPVAFLTCNFQAPVGKMPSLLTHNEVETLFHEFGHCLQHMLTQVDYIGVSGIHGIPWDAVELPSQFLENWTWEKESINLIASHYLTHQPLPDQLYFKMQNAKNFQQAMQMLRQIEFSLFDFKLHLEFDPTQLNQVQNSLNSVRQLTSLLHIPEFNRFQNSFTHIFGGGYAAGYYSYKWAEVMASDAFGLFLEKGIFDPETSRKFLHTFLESGGSVEPLELFIQFRGRPPQTESLLRQTGIVA